MKRYEAFITKDWRATGLANVVVARIDDDGGATAGFFLVDPLCLGVKDAFLLEDLAEHDLREIMDERFHEDMMERMHPAWAKKFIEGAVAYAERLGFEPHRDYRKAKRALGGIDAAMCTETFTYGRDGRPHFVQGPSDDEARTARILAVLKARLGPDGYMVTLREDVLNEPDISGEAIADTRNSITDALKKMKSTDTVHVAAGFITAMLCHPAVFSVDDAMDMFRDDTDENDEPYQEHHLATLDNLMDFYWAQLDGLLDAEMQTDDPWPFDFYEDDFPDQEGFVMALLQWMHGFLSIVETYPEVWAEVRARAALEDHWKQVELWGDPEKPGGLFETLSKRQPKAGITGVAPAGTAADKRSNPREAVVAIYRALREDAEEA